MSDKSYTIDEIRALGEAFKSIYGEQEKHTPASATLTAPALHGPLQGNNAQFGIFSAPGVRPQRFSTLTRPRSMARILGRNRSVYFQELLEVMTGVTASSGTNATGFCGDPPTVGQGKVCQQVYSWGKYYIKTDLEAVAEVGQLRNRADVPADILNMGPEANPLIPDLMYRMTDTRSALQYELWRIGVDLERTLEHVLIQGNNALGSPNTQTGWVAEFGGLDGQIKTGYTDNPTGFACSAMDSQVISFASDINSVIGGGDNRNISLALTDMVFAAQDRAYEMGMENTQWAFVMRKELFRSITEVLSCQYDTHRCNTTNQPTATLNEDVSRTNDLRREMMTGQYLLINDVAYPVIFSEGITQDSQGNNNFKSDLYFVPISWMGMPLLRLEHYPMDNPYSTEWAGFTGQTTATMNDGLYIAGSRSTGLCMEYHFQAKMRLILETPWLAGRIDDVQYRFLAGIRNSDPADTWFHADGGTTYRN